MLGTIFLGDDTVTNDTKPSAPFVDAKRLDTVKLASLGKLVNASPGTLDPLDPTSEDHWVLPIAAAFVSRLATIDDPALAEKWSATPEWKASRGTEVSIGVLLRELKTLAARAVREGKSMYLWMSL